MSAQLRVRLNRTHFILAEVFRNLWEIRSGTLEKLGCERRTYAETANRRIVRKALAFLGQISPYPMIRRLNRRHLGQQRL
ncbi:MAG: hypothetical protein H7Z11_19860 [Verrucomicrobia bacterium]|nr:hypothetical protein [Leptolyngbya sp. ES-bin-22]